MSTEAREQLAEYAHEAWSGWMKYMFEKGKLMLETTSGAKESEIIYVMPAWAVKRWSRQMETAYADLPESEKESDRAEADKIIAIMESHA